MGYRDETDQLRAKVERLESELADARARVDRLSGLAPASEDAGLTTTPSTLLGGPKHVRTVRELDYAITDEGFEAIARLYRERRPGVTVSQVGAHLSAPGLDVRRRDGRTEIALSTSLAHLLAIPFSAGGVLGPLSALFTFGVAHDAFFRGMSEAHALWMLPVGVSVFFLLGLRSARARAKALVPEHHALAEAVAEIASRHRDERAPDAAAAPHVRVDTSHEEEPAIDESTAEPKTRAAE